MGNKKSKNNNKKIKENVDIKNINKSLKFKLVANFDTGSSIYYGFELIDERLLLCICGDYFDVYNLSNLTDIKKELNINPGIYTVSCIQAKTGNIVVCTYGKDMKIFSIEGNEVKEIQTITAERDRENFVSELSNGQLITMNWSGRIKLFGLENGLYKEVKCFEPLRSFNASKLKEIENNKIIIHGWNISNENRKFPLFYCDINEQMVKIITDDCIDFDIMSNKDVIIFNMKNIEMFDIKKFRIILTLYFPCDIKCNSACLYNDNTLLIGCENEELREFEIKNNSLVEIDLVKIKCHVNHHVTNIYKLKNGSALVIGDTEVYIFKPFESN